MAPPIYFFPKTTKAQLVIDGRLSPEILGRYRLDRTFADVGAVADDAVLLELSGPGPGGESGCLFFALSAGGERPVRIDYQPEFQTWRRMAVTPDLYVYLGIDKEHPVTPKDLVRKSLFRGYAIELAGQTWEIPVIRNPEGGSTLPRDWVIEVDGDVTEAVQAQYLELWTEFVGVVDLFFSADDPSPAGTFVLDRAEAIRRAIDVLAVNYRFGRLEQNLLRLVNPQTWASILSAAVDLATFWDVYQRVQAEKQGRLKKTPDTTGEARPESPATSPGSKEDSPDTGPAGPSSSSAASGSASTDPSKTSTPSTSSGAADELPTDH